MREDAGFPIYRLPNDVLLIDRRAEDGLEHTPVVETACLNITLLRQTTSSK